MTRDLPQGVVVVRACLVVVSDAVFQGTERCGGLGAGDLIVVANDG